MYKFIKSNLACVVLAVPLYTPPVMVVGEPKPLTAPRLEPTSPVTAELPVFETAPIPENNTKF